jgi:tetratricopeptide (TPR) repeat protein
VDTAPDDVEARRDLAELLLQIGRADQAATYAKQLVVDQPDLYSNKELLLRTSLAAKDLPSAQAASDAIVEADPKDARGHFYVGKVAEAEGRLEDALRAYQRSLEIRPDAAEPLQGVVRVLLQLKRPKDALVAAEQSISREAQVPLALNLKGEVLLVGQRLDEAQAAFGEAAARRATWWIPYRNLALVELARKDDAAAAAALRDGLAKGAEAEPLRLHLAEVLDTHGHVDEAIVEYEAVIKANPNALSAVNNLAMLLVNAKSDVASLKRAGELVAPLMNSSEPLYLDTYGWVKLRQRDARAALPALERAHSLAPDNPEILYHLAKAQIASNQLTAARVNLDKALRAGVKFPGISDAEAALATLATAPPGAAGGTPPANGAAAAAGGKTSS